MQLQVPRQKRDQTINKKQGTAELNLKKASIFVLNAKVENKT